MDKLQKYEFMQSIEAYLEDNQVHELFDKLLDFAVSNNFLLRLHFILLISLSPRIFIFSDRPTTAGPSTIQSKKVF